MDAKADIIPDHAELLAEFRDRQDLAAVDGLFAQHHEDALAYALSLAGDCADAER